MGRLAGIARHDRPRGPIEVIDHVHVSIEAGLDGDFRGAVKPGGKGRRQVSLIEAVDWDAAMRETGHDLPWWSRRSNLLIDGVDLPQARRVPGYGSGLMSCWRLRRNAIRAAAWRKLPKG